VYLTIVEAGTISAGGIAENTKVYRQDIYKIIPTLEKKGLVTKTMGKPIVIRAIPVEKALKHLVAREEKKSLEKIGCMKKILQEVSSALSQLHGKKGDLANEEINYSLLTEDSEVTNRADMLYENARLECSFVASLEVLTKRADDFRRRFLIATSNGAKIRLIVEAPKRDERTVQILERIRPKMGNLVAKSILSKSPKPFQVFDRKEVWITTAQKRSHSELPCILWSNGRNLVQAYLERFEKLWNSRNAVAIALGEHNHAVKELV
jgi:sugar-specific transcriptional regulator TrmB